MSRDRMVQTTSEPKASVVGHQDESIAELLSALSALLRKHTELVESGDCGFWNAEDEAEVKAARAAIAKATGAER